MEKVPLSVSDFIALTNQTLEYAYPSVTIIGEVQSFKVNQSKYVFFDLRDESSSLNCFMMAFQLRIGLEDGMTVAVEASPKLTQWGKFSLTVRSIKPIGEGSLKRNFELLQKKLSKEGLLSEERKRPLPYMPHHIGVITSTESAGYADFLKIMHERWGGVQIDVRHVTVQGESAADSIIRALNAFNEHAHTPEVIALMRGGGSADDLSVFNDELLVRAIAASRAPIITGIGHETDTTLADMVADFRASTPSNVAQHIVPDKNTIKHALTSHVTHIETILSRQIDFTEQHILEQQEKIHRIFEGHVDRYEKRTATLQQVLVQLNPQRVLDRGYALLRRADGTIIQQASVGQAIIVETNSVIMKAGVSHVKRKK